jgi:glycosyltransferase involved in cell wall biosynthesis
LKILVISDAWRPQINGVVRTLEATIAELARMGHTARVLSPDIKRFCAIRMPFYPEITLEFFARRRIAENLRVFAPDFVHLATEGPLGWAARGVCLREGRAFTTSYHTRFPDYLAARAPRLLASTVSRLSYAVLRRFHAPAGAVMVSTASIERELDARRFRRLVRWQRGVDMNLFRPYGKDLAAYAGLPRPILLYTGRVAVEKNLRAFLDLDLNGSKVVVGDGPNLADLRARYPQAHFMGAKTGEDLARHYAAADLFVFPSLTDTFGLVLLEACAAGLRISACEAPGPVDLFAQPEAAAFSALENDLGRAVRRALALPQNADAPRAFAARFSWEACTRQFYANLQAPSPQVTSWRGRWRHRIGEGT